MKCSICTKKIKACKITGWNKGNNAEPVNNGRCCNTCNTLIVIPSRLRRL